VFNVEYKKYGEIAIAFVHSERIIGTGDVSKFGDEIIRFLEKRPDSHLLLNFEKVDFMSTAMLTELLRINDVVRTQRGSLRVCGLREEMKQVFEVTKLDTIFRIEKDCTECAKRYNKEVGKG
jgi:anti-sigma B factor antagonist